MKIPKHLHWYDRGYSEMPRRDGGDSYPLLLTFVKATGAILNGVHLAGRQLINPVALEQERRNIDEDSISGPGTVTRVYENRVIVTMPSGRDYSSGQPGFLITRRRSLKVGDKVKVTLSLGSYARVQEIV